MNIAPCFFRDAIRIEENKTIAIVDILPHVIGKYIAPIINDIIRSGGIFSRKFFKDFFFSHPIKSKEPAAISQNRDGIKKYAAG